MIGVIKSNPLRCALIPLTIWVLLAGKNPEKLGDRLQFAIPLAGMACSFELREAREYTIRYFSGIVAVHAMKNTLPKSTTMRPDGGSHGFPSGHTFSASYGASYIVRQCAQRVPYLGVVAVLGAGFTASSRVEAEKHNSYQVLFGAIFALLFDRAFRSQRSRRRVADFFARFRKG